MSYLKETVRGISWMVLLRGTTRILGFLRVVILARLLTPKEFGIYGIAALMLAFLEVITETGINVFLIQVKDDIKRYLNTAWILSIGRGLIISLIMFITAKPISVFFKNTESFGIIIFLSIIPLLRGFINPAIIRFQKELNFNKEYKFRTIIFFIDVIIAVILAYLTHSAYSLAWGLLAGVILEIILSFLFVKPTPKFVYNKNDALAVFNRGKWMTAAGIFSYLFHQGDDVVVGRLLGTASLGIYQVAYKVSTLPIYEAGEVFNKVTFPVYVKIREDKKALKDAFVKVTLTISTLVTPFGLGLYFFAPVLIPIILGPNWINAIDTVKILALFGIIRSISGSAYSLFLGVGKQEYATHTTLLSIVGLAATVIPMVNRFGIVGAAYSALIGAILSAPLFLYYSIKILKN